jgi:hypothetical protein
MKRNLLIPLVLITIFAEISCVKKLPPPPSEKIRAQLGTIGVVSAQFVPKVELLVAGPDSMAAQTAGDAFAGAPDPVTACLAIPVGACVGCMTWTVKGQPARDVEKAGEALRRVTAEPKIQEAMRDHFLQTAREQTDHSFVVPKEQGPATPHQEISFGPLGLNGIDTVVEISVLSLGFKSERVEPPAFYVTLHTRLIHVMSGEEVYALTVTYESRGHGCLLWANNDCQLCKEELTRSYLYLADKIVEELFLLYLPPNW